MTSSFNVNTTQGTHFSDGIREGTYFDGQIGNGVATSPIFVYDIVPQAPDADGLVATASYAPGYLPLTAVSPSSTAVTYMGFSGLQLDVPRALSVTSSGNEAGNVWTIFGFDQYGQAMVETISTVNANTVSGQKAFWIVTYVYNALQTVGNVSVGTANIFGLPYLFSSINYVPTPYWDSALIINGTGSTVISIADSTSPATATTNDVRGTITPASAANGVRRLTVGIYIVGAVGSSQNYNSYYGVNQYTQALI